ncbi:Sec-independent protein translocase subunit TatA/TatB [Salinimicrobium sp. HB62]|uniref:Sec-independent protein translocase subunit TatA/TatB n=1 Tax=Salinimicrobium sp. HB62 TaxID=3077781 RepID=UPI002D77B135|nr:twin-arginine translocase TatA/TatE family subunit [Salinimicrobium sp. HB62]
MNWITTLPMFISFTETAFIAFILVMLFGADKIPEIAKGLGKGLRGIRSATDEIKQEVVKSVSGPGTDIKELSNDFKTKGNHIKKELEEFSGPVKRRS